MQFWGIGVTVVTFALDIWLTVKPVEAEITPEEVKPELAAPPAEDSA